MNRRWIFLVFALGLFFIWLSFYSNSSRSDSGLKLAELRRQTGDVVWSPGDHSTRQIVKDHHNIGPGDYVETDEIGEGELSFENGSVVMVMPVSMVTIDHGTSKDDLASTIIIQHGDIRIDKVGQLGELWISKNGERLLASNYNDSSLRVAKLPPKPLPAQAAAETSEPLSEGEISTTVNSHEREFFKCYARLLQKQPQAKGDISMNFSIVGSGKSSNPEIQANWKSGTGDEEFSKCLKDVVLRIDFRPFKGRSITTVFPLKFE